MKDEQEPINDPWAPAGWIGIRPVRVAGGSHFGARGTGRDR
jgi:hypothetical protein